VAGISVREEAEIQIFPRLEKRITRQFLSIGAVYYTVFSVLAKHLYILVIQMVVTPNKIEYTQYKSSG
jgi:hypothetical protein